MKGKIEVLSREILEVKNLLKNILSLDRLISTMEMTEEILVNKKINQYKLS